MSDNNVVPIRTQTELLRANPAVPPEIFEKLQALGAQAVNHLGDLMSDPRFKYFAVKDQMRVIDAVLMRAYGQPDGSVRRNLNYNMNESVDDPAVISRANVIRELSTRASQSRLPEFNHRPTSREKQGDVVDAVVVKQEDQ